MSDWTWEVANYTDHGFTWGPFEAFAMTRIPDKGGCLGVDVAAKTRIQIYASEKGRKVRMYVDGIEWKAVSGDPA